MSLQVWFPLNEDLHNQGLSPAEATLSGSPSINTSGKIGSCYSFDGVDDCITLSGFNPKSWAQFSLTCWCYFPTSIGSLFLIRGSKAHRLRVHSDGFSFRDTNNSTLRTVSWGTTLPTATWIHVACVYDRGKVYNYINGICTKSSTTYYNSTSVLYDDLNEIRIARQQTTSSNSYYTGCINDFRIYDHALSTKEVEEISKGLVLHYKLDGQKDYFPSYAENLLIGSGFTDIDFTNMTESSSSTNWTKYIRWYNGSKSIHTFANGVDTIKLNTTGNLGICFVRSAVDIDLDPNSYYTLSCEAQCTKSGAQLSIATSYRTTGNAWTWRGGTNKVTFSAVNTWQTFTLTFKPDSDTQYICYCFTCADGASGSTHTFSIRHCKLEKGSTATAWCPNSAENEYMPFILSQNEEYDLSGYNNNGTLNNITLISDTARYNYAYQFNGSNSYIKINNTSIMPQGAREMTINLWAKNSSWATNTHFFSCTESGGFNTEAGDSGYLRFPVHVYTDSAQTSTAYKYDSKELQLSAIPANEWVMLTWVYNSTGIKTYINGQLHHTYTNTSYGIHFNHNARLFLGCEASNATPTTPYYNGQMSDFRLYYTALTDNQIQELYNTSMSIDNNGNGYVREAVEDSKLNITKTGQFHANEFLDDNNYTIASITKVDEQLKVKTIYEY